MCLRILVKKEKGTVWYLFYIYFSFLVNFGSPNIIAMMPQIPIKTG
ncbi:hypothetical protein PT2222_180117 [Paraburkholderia tropica]